MTKVILHVEDEENDVILFRHAMTKAGQGVLIQVATDGQKAIDYLNGTGDFANRDAFPFPRLVLLDLKLPHVSGVEVVKWIRQEAQLSLPVVILTSSESDGDIAAAYEAGVNAYVVKPSDTRQLTEIAKAIRDFWVNLNRLRPNVSTGKGAPKAASAGF